MITRKQKAGAHRNRGTGQPGSQGECKYKFSPAPLHRRSTLAPLPLSQSGFTIIESLMAIVVVGILMIAISPAIVLSVTNRVQSRRVEQAAQAARAYVDGVRSGAIAAPNYTVTLNEVNSSGVFTPQRDTFASVAAPTSSGSLTCTTSTTGYPYCQNTSTSSLYCIDLDNTAGCSNTSTQDLVIQAFRTNNAQNYILSLRVYRADAFSDTTALKTQKQMGTKQATYTGGLGNRKAPLVEITTEITTAQPLLKDFCDRLGGCK